MFSKIRIQQASQSSKSSAGLRVARIAPRCSIAPVARAASTYSASSVIGSGSSGKWMYALGAAAVAGLFVMNQSDEQKGKAENLLASAVAYAAEKIPIYGVPGTVKERSFIAIKPDGVHRSLIGEVISRFEKKGYKLVGIKVLVPSKEFAEKHYSDLSTKPFFPSLVNYFSSGPVVAMVWEGKDVISGGRTVIGATNPQQATPGTVRGDYAIAIGRNLIHGSDSADSAQHEISLWFNENEVADFDHALNKWINEAK